MGCAIHSLKLCKWDLALTFLDGCKVQIMGSSVDQGGEEVPAAICGAAVAVQYIRTSSPVSASGVQGVRAPAL